MSYICKNSLCFVLAPQCPLVFGISVSHGAILCGNDSVTGKQRQRCEVFCDQGYINALPVETFLCDLVTRTWLNEAPLAYACQSKICTHSNIICVKMQLSPFCLHLKTPRMHWSKNVFFSQERSLYRLCRYPQCCSYLWQRVSKAAVFSVQCCKLL